MLYFRRTIKDLIKLSDITYKEEKRTLIAEYNQMLGDLGDKNAKKWLFNAKKERRKKFLDSLANSWLKEDK